MDGAAWLAACNQRFLDCAERQLPQAGWPLHDAIRHGVLVGGKRLRPALVYGVDEALGGGLPAGGDAGLSLADRVALAVELVHCYSLIHDDLPAMDDALTRRGEPSCHRVYGEAVAILAGDALQPLAFAQLTGPEVDAGLSTQMVRELADACGHFGIIQGQAMDLLPESADYDAGQIGELHALKTTRLMLCAARLVCLARGLPAADPRFAALESYAQGLGSVFQIRDDWLDREEDEREGRPNLMVRLGTQAAQKRADDAMHWAGQSLRGAGMEAPRLHWLLEYCATRTK